MNGRSNQGRCPACHNERPLCLSTTPEHTDVTTSSPRSSIRLTSSARKRKTVNGASPSDSGRSVCQLLTMALMEKLEHIIPAGYQYQATRPIQLLPSNGFYAEFESKMETMEQLDGFICDIENKTRTSIAIKDRKIRAKTFINRIDYACCNFRKDKCPTRIHIATRKSTEWTMRDRSYRAGWITTIRIKWQHCGPKCFNKSDKEIAEHRAKRKAAYVSDETFDQDRMNEQESSEDGSRTESEASRTKEHEAQSRGLSDAARIITLNDEIARLEDDRQRQRDEVIRLEGDQKRQREEIARLERDRKRQREEITRLEDDRKRQREEINRLEDDRKRQREEITYLEDDRKRQRDEIARLEDDLRKRDALLEDHRKKQADDVMSNEFINRCMNIVDDEQMDNQDRRKRHSSSDGNDATAPKKACILGEKETRSSVVVSYGATGSSSRKPIKTEIKSESDVNEDSLEADGSPYSLKLGFVVPDEDILCNVNPDDVARMLEAFRDWRANGTVNWSMALHSKLILRLGDVKNSFPASHPKRKEATKLLLLFHKYRSDQSVILLDEHECDHMKQAASEYLTCIQSMKAKDPEAEFVLLTNTSPNGVNSSVMALNMQKLHQYLKV